MGKKKNSTTDAQRGRFLYLFLAASLPLMALGFIAGYYAAKGGSAVQTQEHPEVHRQIAEYPLINPLLECEGAELTGLTELRSFKDKAVKFIEAETGSGRAVKIAVYFRSLNDGLWFGVDEREKFSPGSLLKIPLMIGYFKEAERNPALLKEKLAYNLDMEKYITQIIRPSEEIEKGKKYTVAELIRRMIVYSDNRAFLTLVERDKDGRLFKMVYNDLGLMTPVYDTPDVDISIKQYTSFLRILYNSSYLDKNYSETGLKLLSESQFKEGLVAGVPSGVMVAHKFGERDVRGIRQLHDCGIVYYPRSPYMLCVMTRGSDFNALTGIIAGISKLTYDEIDAQLGPEYVPGNR